MIQLLLIPSIGSYSVMTNCSCFKADVRGLHVRIACCCYCCCAAFFRLIQSKATVSQKQKNEGSNQDVNGLP